MSAAQTPYFEPVSFLNQRIECDSEGVYSIRYIGDGFVSLDYYGESIVRIKIKNRLHQTVYEEIKAILGACFFKTAIDMQREIIGL